MAADVELVWVPVFGWRRSQPAKEREAHRKHVEFHQTLAHAAFDMNVNPEECDRLVRAHNSTERIVVSEQAAQAILRCR